MSEVASRPAHPRGRGAGRGGRGGARGSIRGRGHANGTYKDTPEEVDDFADQGELGDMKKQYSSQLPLLKELFSDWTEVDLLFALQETDGALESTIERISEGHVSKFSDVKSTKDKSKPKARDGSVQASDAAANSTRSTRGRGGFDSARGGRGRPDRGRGGFRGGRGATHAATNGTRAAVPATSIPTAESGAWDTQPATDGAAPEVSTKAPNVVAPQDSIKSRAPAEASGKKTWAQMFAKPPPAPAQPKPVPETTPTLEAPSEASSGFVEVTHADAEPEELPIPTAADEVPVHEPPELSDADGPVIELTPSKDQLTEENVEHLPSTAHPPPTGTAASTVESSRGPDSVTPSTVGQNLAQAPIGRPALGGFQTTAYKATGAPGAGGRSASFQRRLVEQQEAVVMPGNHAVDRTAVQFGSLGLSGDALDVDEDREEAETRTQPPQHSPVAQPRASLPPASRQQPAAAEAPLPEAAPTIKAAPGLPPAPQQQQPFSHQSPNTLASQAQQGSHTGQGYNQFSRYGQANLPSESATQKQYDPFGQQVPSAFEGYPSSTQAPSQQTQSQVGGFSSAGTDYSSYYTADQRNAYQNFYNSYGQQNAASQQDAGASQQRTGSGFGATGDSAFPTSQPQQQTQARYGEAQQSGHSTPNPAAVGGQQQQTTGAQSQQTQPAHQQQPHGQAQHQGYPYSQHAYYNSPYWSAYQNQYSPYGQQGGFGGPFGGKGAMYNQPHHGYGQNAYDQHSSSPANAGAFGGRETSLASGLGEYGRSGSTQPSHTASAGAFGSDPFSRSQSGFPGNQAYGQQQSAQQGSGEDSLKPFGDPKSGAGPSPSSIGQPGRPGSATNTAAAQGAQSGLPPPQSHQQGFGAYPGHPGQMGQTSQYGGGLGGLGGHTAGAQTHQAGQYGAYGAGFGNSYGSYGGRGGGWGGNYGH